MKGLSGGTLFVSLLGSSLAFQQSGRGQSSVRRTSVSSPTRTNILPRPPLLTKEFGFVSAASHTTRRGEALCSKAPGKEEVKETTNRLRRIDLRAEDRILEPDVEPLSDTSLIEEEKTKELGIWAARGLLLLVAAIWGTNFASVKYLNNLCFHPPCNHPPSEAALARFGVAALVSMPLLIGKRWDIIRSGLECGFFITIGYICQSLALDTIESGKCAFICSLTVITVPLISAIFYGKPIKPGNILAAAIALSGVAVLEGMIDVSSIFANPAVAETVPSFASALDTASTMSTNAPSFTEASAAVALGPFESFARSVGVEKGDLLALGQPIGFGISFTRIEYYQDKFRDIEGSTIVNAAAQCVMVGFLSLLWVLYDYHGIIPNFSYMIEPHRIATVLWTGIVTTVVAIFLQGTALKTATATDAAITFSSEPVWASLFGFLLLKEQLQLSVYVGGAIVLLACLVGSLTDVEKEPEEFSP